MQVLWTAESLADLESIYEFIAAESQQAARKIVEQILYRAKQLETFPESGPIQESLRQSKEYRYLVEGNYKIVYNFDKANSLVSIRLIFDTRFNPEKLKADD